MSETIPRKVIKISGETRRSLQMIIFHKITKIDVNNTVNSNTLSSVRTESKIIKSLVKLNSSYFQGFLRVI